jgi:hypothetical protein
MTSRGGAAPPSHGRRGGVQARAVSIGPSFAAPENSLLQRVRANRLLDQIRHSDSQQQVRRITRLVGDLAAITSTLTMSLCDLLFRFMSGQEEQYVQRHHSISLQAVEIINDLCAQPDVLQDWGFPPEHCRVTARQLGVFTGFGGLQHCAPDRADLGQPFPQPAELDEAPFLNQMMFLLLSRDLPPLALARCLSRARFGSWSSDRRSFFPARPHGQGQQMRWAVRTEDTQDLGVVHVTFVGVDIVSFRFEQAWPRARFRHSKHFMPARYALEAVDDTRRV